MVKNGESDLRAAFIISMVESYGDGITYVFTQRVNVKTELKHCLARLLFISVPNNVNKPR